MVMVTSEFMRQTFALWNLDSVINFLFIDEESTAAHLSGKQKVKKEKKAELGFWMSELCQIQRLETGQI